jgi:exopolysaccharide production protein ExoZ
METKLPLRSIQYLRAAAAAAVVISHAANSLLGAEQHLIDLDYGACGVDIFFVVSGFIMYYTSFGLPTRPGEFLLKRLIRIFPLYFILSTIMFALLLFSPVSFNKESPDFPAYIESIFFIPHWNPRLHNLEPLIGPGWTLNYEIFFYILFAGSLFFRRPLRGMVVIPVITALVIMGCLYRINNAIYLTYTDSLSLEFCFGIAIAASYLNPTKSGLHRPLALVVVILLAIAYMNTFLSNCYGNLAFRFLYIGAPCALIVTVAVGIEWLGRLPKLSIAGRIGDASYSLYLMHFFVLGAGQHIWRALRIPDSRLSHSAFIASILGTSIMVALIAYRHIELPIGRRLTAAAKSLRFLNPSSVSSTAAGT